MADQSKAENQTNEAPAPKPPRSSGLSANAPSDSFRAIEYLPKDGGEAVKNEETVLASLWRRLSSGARPSVEPMKSDAVVEELSRRNSLGAARQGSRELPPLAPQSPRLKSQESGKVGLPTVKLVSTETPSLETDKPPETKEEVLEQKKEIQTPDSATGEETAVPKVEKTETGMEFGARIPLAEHRISLSGYRTSEEQPAEEEEIKTEETLGGFGSLQESVDEEKANVEDATTEPAVAVAGQLAAASPVETTGTKKKVKDAPSEVQKIGDIGAATVGDSMKETSQAETPALRAVQTMGKSNSQRGLLRRIFTFGGGGGGGGGAPIDQSAAKEGETKEVPAAEETEETIPAVEAPKEAESPASTEDPSGSQSPPTSPPNSPEEKKITGVAAEELEKRHAPTSSDITPQELEELRASFLTEIQAKGVEVAGKYTKSSADFDSPLMFLLDLHTFAETQHSSVRMEKLLQEKYGAEHSLVAEFTSAASRELETHPQAEEKTPTPQETPAAKETPAEKEAPAANETPAATETPAEKKTPTETETPAEKEALKSGIYATGSQPSSHSKAIESEVVTTGLDTAEDTMAEEAKNEATTGGSSSTESQVENKEPETATVSKDDSKKASLEPQVETTQATEEPPVIPPYHNEAEETGTQKWGCFRCACFHPKVN